MGFFQGSKYGVSGIPGEAPHKSRAPTESGQAGSWGVPQALTENGQGPPEPHNPSPGFLELLGKWQVRLTPEPEGPLSFNVVHKNAITLEWK